MEDEEKIKMIEVYMVVNPETKVSELRWTFHNNPNGYNLIGILEHIKHSMMNNMEAKVFGEDNGRH